MITVEQVKAARKLLGWSQLTLSFEAGLSQRTVVDFETRVGQPREKTVSRIQHALESAGVEFAAEGATGARLSKTTGTSAWH
jgi:transcriptional regulator with XRE-family HTH domain